jgi:hypothetical protein
MQGIALMVENKVNLFDPHARSRQRSWNGIAQYRLFLAASCRSPVSGGISERFAGNKTGAVVGILMNLVLDLHRRR